MIKAVVVKYLGEKKIVLASNSNIADFLTNASKKFDNSDISGIMWNGCEVDSETFVAILNEQNLEVEVVSLAKNNELSTFVQSLKGFSPVKAVFSAVDRHSDPVSFDFNNQQSIIPQLPTESTLYQDSNYEDVLEDLDVSSRSQNLSLISTAAQVAEPPKSSAEPPGSQKVILSCSNCSFQTSKQYVMISHLKLHGQEGSVVCENCFSKFKSVKGFKLHNRNCFAPFDTEIEVINNNNDFNIEKPDDFQFLKENRKDQLAALALHLRGKYRCSENVVNIIFSSLQNIFNNKSQNEEISTICKELSTEYSRTRYFQTAFKMPQIQLVYKNSLHGCFIPFKEILQFIFTSNEYDKFLEYSSEISISLYSDDLGVTNPIGKSRGKHKLWVLYFQLLNIPQCCLSKSFSIFPLAITGSKSVKVKGFMKSLLLDLVQSLNELSSIDSSTLTNANGKKFMVKLKHFIGDSLTCNAIAGFKEGFSKKVVRCCRVCNSTRSEMLVYNKHSQCKIRSLEEHKMRVKELDNSSLPRVERLKWSKLYGVQSNSVLSEINEFDVTKQVLFDPMHDLLEGVIPLQIELYLNHGVLKGFFTIDSLNNFIKLFQYPKDSEKPPVIVDLVIKGKFGSAQVLSICRILPIFLRSITIDCHFLCLIKLLRILQMCLSPVTTEAYFVSLEETIAAHHTLFMNLYPDKFIPKLHFLIHYPEQSRQFGSLRYHMCMAFERKHQVIKNVRHFNFKNMPLSAMKSMVLNTVASFYNSFGEISNGVLCELNQVTIKKNIVTCIQINGIKYCPESSLWFHDGFQSSAFIIKEIQVKGEKTVFITSQLQCLNYNVLRGFFTAVEDNTVPFRTIAAEGLAFPWPAFYFKEGDIFYIVPPALPFLII